MKKESKFIEDHPKALNINLEFVEQDIEDNVAIESDSPFVIVSEFSDGAKSFKSFTPKEETKVKDNIVYAEEVFEDEDDIYSTELHDRLIQKASHRLLSVIGKDIDDAYLANGKQANVGLDLLSSMQFSRLINVEGDLTKNDNMQVLFETLGVPFFSITPLEESNIAYNNTLYDAISFAKANRNKPVFIYVNSILGKDLFDYLRPLYTYIDNPTNDCYITAGGRNTNIPTNLWVFFSLNGDEIYQVSRRILRYSSILNVSILEVKKGEKSDAKLSLEEIKASLSEASERRSIEEESWKKVDSLVRCIGAVNGYSLQNKITLRLEAFAATLFCLDKEDDEVIDIALSRCVINEAIITNDVSKYSSDNDLDLSLTNSFGGDKMMLTRNAIKRYFDYMKNGGK